MPALAVYIFSSLRYFFSEINRIKLESCTLDLVRFMFSLLLGGEA